MSSSPRRSTQRSYDGAARTRRSAELAYCGALEHDKKSSLDTKRAEGCHCQLRGVYDLKRNYSERCQKLKLVKPARAGMDNESVACDKYAAAIDASVLEFKDLSPETLGDEEAGCESSNDLLSGSQTRSQTEKGRDVVLGIETFTALQSKASIEAGICSSCGTDSMAFLCPVQPPPGYS